MAVRGGLPSNAAHATPPCPAPWPQGSRRDLQRHAGPPAALQDAVQPHQHHQLEAPAAGMRPHLPSPRGPFTAAAAVATPVAAPAAPWAPPAAAGEAPVQPSGVLPMAAPPAPLAGELAAWLSGLAGAAEEGSGARGSGDISTCQPSASGGTTFPSPAAAALPSFLLAQPQLPHVPAQPPRGEGVAALMGGQGGTQLQQALQALLQAGGQPPAGAPAPHAPPLSQLLAGLLGQWQGQAAPAAPAVLAGPSAPPAAASGAGVQQATSDLLQLLARLVGGQQQPPPAQGGQ